MVMEGKLQSINSRRRSRSELIFASARLYFEIFFSEKIVVIFHANFLLGNNLHETSNPIYGEKEENATSLSLTDITQKGLNAEK